MFPDSWAPLIFPYIDHAQLYEQYNFKVDWTNSANDSGLNQIQISTFLCPSAPSTTAGGNKLRGVLNYPSISDVTRPNPYVTTVPPADSTNIGVLGKGVYRKLTDITDGTTNTILLAEDAGRNERYVMGQYTTEATSGDGAWANPAGNIAVGGFNSITTSSPGPIAINGWNDNEVYSFHPNCAGALFADGSVHYLNAGISLQTLISLVTRAGGEIIPDTVY